MSFSEWREVKLGEISEIKGGKRLPKGTNLLKEKNDHPYIRVRDLGSKNIVLSKNFEYVDNVTFQKISRYIVTTGDIIISIVGTVGLVGIVGETLNNANLTENCVKIINLSKLDKDFLYYYLISDKGQYEISRGTVGAVQPKLPIKNIQDISIFLPPLPEQKVIAATLSCLDDKIELNNRMNKNLEEMAQAIFKSWFVDFEPFQDGKFEESELGMIPKGWRVVELGDIATFVKGKKPKVLDMKPCDISSTPYLTIDVLNGGLPQYASSEKMVLAEKFDILMVMDGASSGTVYYGLAGIVASTLAKYKVDKDDLLEIVYQYLKFYEDDIKSHNTGSAIPHTDKGFVSKIKVLIPDEQSKMIITEIFNRIRLSVLENKFQSQKLIEIRDTLLPKLMSGEIRVPIEEVQ